MNYNKIEILSVAVFLNIVILIQQHLINDLFGVKEQSLFKRNPVDSTYKFINYPHERTPYRT